MWIIEKNPSLIQFAEIGFTVHDTIDGGFRLYQMYAISTQIKPPSMVSGTVNFKNYYMATELILSPLWLRICWRILFTNVHTYLWLRC